MIVSERKFATRDILLITIGILLLIGYVFSYRYFTTRPTQSDGISVRGSVFKTEIVSTPEEKARGLSGRDGIERDTAMVFEFDQTSQHCLWMKDMKFAIDMVWLDESRKVVAIERDVTPETYPKTFCHDGKTVVEFAAGTADRLPMYVGDQFSW